MKVLHILALGGAGGIESLSVDVARKSEDENYFYFLYGGGKNADKIKEITGNIEIRHFRNINVLAEYKYFERYCLSNYIECVVVQGMSPLMLIFATILKKRHKEIKEVLYVHSDANHLFQDKKQKLSFNFAYKYANGCIAISNYIKETVAQTHGDVKKVKVIYNGVDVSRFSPKNKAAQNCLRIIFVGRLIDGKGVDILLKAAAETDIDYRLTIVGDGPERENLEKLAEKLQIGDKVEFAGVQWNVSEWLKDADVFVHSARCNEGFGITLVESMASGVPCIAVKKGAIPEIIDAGIDGFILEENNEVNLAKKLKEVQDIRLNDCSRWNRICMDAQKKASKFTIEQYVQNLSAYLAEV